MSDERHERIFPLEEHLLDILLDSTTASRHSNGIGSMDADWLVLTSAIEVLKCALALASAGSSICGTGASSFAASVLAISSMIGSKGIFSFSSNSKFFHALQMRPSWASLAVALHIWPLLARVPNQREAENLPTSGTREMEMKTGPLYLLTCISWTVTMWAVAVSVSASNYLKRDGAHR